MANRAYIRFTDIDIPQGTDIEDANLEIKSYGSSSDAIDVIIYVVPEVNPSNPTSKAELDSLSVTGATPWSITESWVDGAAYTSPSISAGVQNVLNLSNWTPGSSMMIIIEDDASTNSRSVNSFEYGNASDLKISYADTVTTAPWTAPVPVSGLSIQASDVGGGGTQEIADFATMYFRTLTVYNDHIWAGSDDGEVWLYGQSTSFEWSHQGGVYDFPVSDIVYGLAGLGGSLYGGVINSDYIYKYVGGWTQDYQFSNPVRSAHCFARYKGENYCGISGNSRVLREDAIAGWTTDLNPAFGFHFRKLLEHDNDLYATMDGNAALYRKQTGSWSQILKPGENRAYGLSSCSDGNLYWGTTISNGGTTGRIYQWDGNSGSIVADNVEGKHIRAMFELNNYLYFGLYGSNSTEFYRIDLNNLTLGSDNTETVVNLANGYNIYDMVYYKGYLYMSATAPDGTGQVLVYNDS